MTTNEKLKEYVTSKCYEVQELKSDYRLLREKYVSEAMELIKNRTPYWASDVSVTIGQMERNHNLFEQGYRDISQLCHALGGEYLEIFVRILGDQKGERE